MRVLLQNVKSGLYFTPGGSWSDKAEDAQEFPNSLGAIHFCNANNLKEVQVLLKFKQHRYDIVLPVLRKSDSP
jgi:hypothetical protein